MIARLTGTVVEVSAGNLVLEVSGVGYLVSVTSTLGVEKGEKLSLHTHLAVRENALDLYGFKEREELLMFYELNKIPKVGPKTALQILSQVDLVTLKKAVASEDPAYLTKMSGIGKKSAEKIVLGLKDSLGDMALEESEVRADGSDSDVIDALVTLGYSQRDALAALQKVSKDAEGTNERIKQALKELSR